MKFIGVRLLCRLPLWILGSASLSPALTEKILEDVPGRLVLELQAAGASINPVPAARGMQVTCPGCHSANRTDAPDLPTYRFDVLSGPLDPIVTLQILESEALPVPEGIAPVPRTPTPATVAYHPDPALFRSAASASFRILDRRVLRGAPVLGIEVPLALWSGEPGKGGVLTLIKRVRVQLDFPGVLPRSAAPKLEARYLKAVKNPIGGPYLYAVPPAASRGLSLAIVLAESSKDWTIR